MIEDKQTHVWAHYADDFNSVIRINAWKFDGDHRLVMRGDQFEDVGTDVYRVTDEYGIQISKHEAQRLLDCLWELGIRPSNGDGNVGQLAATQAHLKDMQNLAHVLLGKIIHP